MMLTHAVLALAIAAAPAEAGAALAPAQAADTAAIRELTEIEARLATTYKAGDCDGWAAQLAPDWSVIHITGTVITRGEAVQACKALPAPLETLVFEDLVVRPYGDTAVVTGRTTVRAAGQTVLLRFTDVFVRRDGKWLVVASHATRLAQ